GEFNAPEYGFSVQKTEVLATNLPIAVHAHARKSETFVIIKGGGFVLAAKVDKTGKLLENPKKTLLKIDSVVYFPPLAGHTFYLNPGSKMICYSSEPYDEKNPDFISCPDLVMK
ncbi:MAG: hypothetical protein Q8Q46_02495, partial [Candidatus Giovannonibacteria bacterium]|nr:hypothetical protein [Candidatus Giovannonibacteria bacterium]